MAKLIKLKLGNSKKRLNGKIKEIQDLITESKIITKYDAAQYSMELTKKGETFRRHMSELENAIKGDGEEEEKFINDYDALEEILNTADELQTKLDFMAKYEDERKKEKTIKEEKEREADAMLTKEKFKIEYQCIRLELEASLYFFKYSLMK